MKTKRPSIATAVYIAVLTPDPDGGYSVEFPDVPGAITEGDTLADTLANAREALELMLEGMLDDGDELPAPRGESDIRALLEPGEVMSAINAALGR